MMGQHSIPPLQAAAKSGRVLAFPVARQITLVRAAAEAIRTRPHAASDRYWRTTCRMILARLHAVGLGVDAANVELQAFAAAVRREIARKDQGDVNTGS